MFQTILYNTYELFIKSLKYSTYSNDKQTLSSFIKWEVPHQHFFFTKKFFLIAVFKFSEIKKCLHVGTEYIFFLICPAQSMTHLQHSSS